MEEMVSKLYFALAVLSFRALPFALWFASSRRFGWPTRVAALLCCGGMLASSGDDPRAALTWTIAGFAYYAVALYAVRSTVSLRAATSGTDRMAVFALAFLLLLVLPPLVLGPRAYAFLSLGWDLVLKAVSFAADTGGRVPSLRSSAFYFFVNPVLVYSQRAELAEQRTSYATRRKACGRALAGVGVVVVAVVLLEPLAAESTPQKTTLGAVLSFEVLLFGAAKLVSAYAAQSGVVSFQIGVLRALGYRVPESFAYPLAARSPAEFWSQWNIYVGEWVKRYLFLPLALRVARMQWATSPNRAIVAAVLISFAAVGLFHDAFTWLVTNGESMAMTAFMAANGLLVVVWAGAERALSRRAGRNDGPHLPRRMLFAVVNLAVIGVCAMRMSVG